MPASRFDPMVDRADVVARLLAAYERAGMTLRKSAKASGIHVATLCRWLLRSPALRAALRGAAARAMDAHRDCLWQMMLAAPPRARRLPPERPRHHDEVPVHPDCPCCVDRGMDKGTVEVRRSTSGRLFWWECRVCEWRTWRPRHPQDCQACGGPRYWSHNRRSIACPRCRTRERTALPLDSFQHGSAAAGSAAQVPPPPAPGIHRAGLCSSGGGIEW
jgi:hypothetical protein